jgi:hypothetical protein
MGFRCELDENCALLAYQEASSGNIAPTFWDSQSIPSSEFKKNSWPRQMRSIAPETSATNNFPTLRNSPEYRKFNLDRGRSLISGEM